MLCLTYLFVHAALLLPVECHRVTDPLYEIEAVFPYQIATLLLAYVAFKILVFVT